MNDAERRAANRAAFVQELVDEGLSQEEADASARVMAGMFQPGSLSGLFTGRIPERELAEIEERVAAGDETHEDAVALMAEVRRQQRVMNNSSDVRAARKASAGAPHSQAPRRD